VARHADPQMLIFRSKPLISKDFFLLNWSSICHGTALARVGAGWKGCSQQSYPQLL
jgi:hypothetical protein